MSYEPPSPLPGLPDDVVDILNVYAPERLRRVAHFAEKLAEYREREARYQENENDAK